MSNISDVLAESRKPGKILEFSWQFGVFDNPGSQGWHGLKGKVSDGFFILDQGGHQIYRRHLSYPMRENDNPPIYYPLLAIILFPIPQ